MRNSALYYKDRSGAPKYKKAPPGILKPARIPCTKKYWQELIPSTKLKPKKLILADFTAISWGEFKCQQVQKTLLKLQKEGFSLYVWQENKIRPLIDVSILNNEEILLKISPETQEEIARIAIAHNPSFTQDNLHILDDSQLNLLLDSFFDTTDTADTTKSMGISPYYFSIQHSLTKIREAKIKKIIQQAEKEKNVHVEFRNLTIFTYKEIKNLEEMRLALPIVTNFKTIGLNLHEFKNLSVVEKTFIAQTLKSSKTLMQCQSLAIEGGSSSPEFFQEILHLFEVSPDNAFFCLERIALFEGKTNIIDNAQLINLPRVAPNLREVQLNWTPQLDLSINHLCQHLSHLQSLLLFSVNSITSLKNLLENTFTGNQIHLHDCNFSESTLTFRPGSLPALEETHIYNSYLSTTQLNSLLTAAGNLRRIVLFSGHNLENPLILEKNSLPLLQEISINEREILLVNLAILFEAGPKLKSINIKNADLLEEILPLESNTLLHLENLSLVEIGISSSNLIAFLKAAPYLKRLIFVRNFLSDNLSTLTPESLPFLEDLNISHSNLTLEDLKNFFSAAPNIKKFHCIGCFFSTGQLALENSSLLSLEEIYISNTTFSISDLNTLLKAAPRLDNLVLKDFAGFSENTLLTLEPDSLLHLTYINLSASNISADSLINLLEACPNLLSLNLGYTEIKVHSGSDLEKLLAKIPHLEANIISAQEEKKTLATQYQENASHSSKRSYTGISVGRFIGNIFSSAVSHAASKSHSSVDQAKITQKTKVDIDTTLGSGSVSYNFIFYPINGYLPIPVTSYRLQTFDRAAFSSNDAEFEVYNTRTITEEDLIFCSNLQQENEDVWKLGRSHSDYTNYCYGKQTFTLGSEWHSIASLSPDELMTHYHIAPNEAAKNIEIRYSEQDNLYYIRLKRNTEPQKITIDFLLKPGDTQLLKARLDSEIQAIVNEFKAFPLKIFQTNKLKLDYKKNKRPDESIEDYIVRAIREQKVGACRHRAVAFKCLMQKQYPHIPVRIISNDCHMFVEVKQGDTWISCDLGGHPAIPKMSAKSAHQIIKSQESSWIPNQYLQRFETWKTKQNIPRDNITHYIQHIFNGGHEGTDKQHLIQVPTNDLQHLNREILQHARNINRPVFYAHSPDDLVCSAPFIQRNATNRNQGHLHQESTGGGSLHDFLTQHQNNPADTAPILIVNYANFEAEDIIRLNSLLNNKREADGTAIPENTLIIGLIDPNNPESYDGADFYSRFKGAISQAPDSFLIPQREKPLLTPLKDSFGTPQDSEREILNLCHSPAWQTQLIGEWIFNEDILTFNPGELIQKLTLGKTIEIQNPPKDDDTFDLFLEQLSMYGKIVYEGETLIELTEEQKELLKNGELFVTSEGYNWESMLSKVSSWQSSSITPPTNAYILNPTVLADFICRYSVNNQRKSLTTQAGILKEHQQSNSLPIYVTRSLNEDEWGIFFNEAKKYPELTLSITCAPGVELPPEWSALVQNVFETRACPQSAYLEEGAQPNEKENTTCIYTNDPDATIAQLTSQNTPDPQDFNNWLVIDVSEYTANDLLRLIDVKIEKETLNYHFTEREQVLMRELNKGRKIILTGTFSDELLDGLSSYLIKRQQNIEATGELILVSSTRLSFMANLNHHITGEAKKTILIEKGFTSEHLLLLQQEEPTCLEIYSLTELTTRLTYIKHHKQESTISSNNAWSGLKYLPSRIKIEPFSPDEDHATQAAAFTQARYHAVEKILFEQNQPFVFLAGLTGTGKTSFIKQNFKKDDRLVYQGEEKQQMLEWAKYNEYDEFWETEKILFIDEANLSCYQWSQFEGLFQNPPSIIIDGQYYPLTPKHKVIFAGNPLSYGDERHLATLFERHGNALIFEPLSTSFIYEKVIKPIFENTSLTKNNIDIIAEELFAVYKSILELPGAKDEVLISPREIQMMALLVNNRIQQYLSNKSDNDAIRQIAKFYAQSIGVNLVPQKDRPSFLKAFPPIKLESSYLSTITTNTNPQSDFLFTESRHSTLCLLHDYISLRDFRRKNHTDDKEKLNGSQLFGGLGGIIIEGDPGVGKSEMIVQYLLGQNFIEGEANLAYQPPNNTEIFYRIPVGMEFEAKKNCLIKAFHEGAVVIIDEINSAPMMEQLLNSLLMGETPDGASPEKPGFMIIGTQNPITMSGRRAPSTALARRMQTCYLPPYTEKEICTILEKKGLSEEISQDLTQAFLIKCQQAKKNNYSPSPVFRDLITAADDLLYSGQQQHDQKRVKQTKQLGTVKKNHTKTAYTAAPNSSSYFSKQASRNSSTGVTPPLIFH